MTMRMAAGTYDIANVRLESRSVLTNTVPTVAYRGAGRRRPLRRSSVPSTCSPPSWAWTPPRLRRRNLVGPERFPFTTAMGTTYDSGDYPGSLEKLLAAADYDALRAEQAARRESRDPVQLGLGLAVYVEITAMSGGNELGSVEVFPKGDSVCARVITGTTPYGQGHRTTWAMLVSDRLGIPMEDVEVIHGDTDLVSRSDITGGSRSVQIGGTNVWRAAGTVADRAREVAARLLEADVADVVLEDGAFHVAGTPSIAKTWLEVATAAAESGEDLSGEGDFTQDGGNLPLGSAPRRRRGRHRDRARPSASPDRRRRRRSHRQPAPRRGSGARRPRPGHRPGVVRGGRLRRRWQSPDEQLRRLRLPLGRELPSFETIHMETASPQNDLGAKGIGESGTIGATPAVQNAVVDALAHLGVRHVDMPCTAERVWRAIQQVSAPV